MRAIRGGAHFNIIGHAKRWLALSGLVVLVSIVALYMRGINAGLEFTGGTSFQAEARNDASVERIRDALEDVGLENVTVQEIGTNGFLVQTEHLEPREQEQAADRLAELVGTEPSEVNITTVGPKWGAQITNKAIRALGFFLLFTLIYLSIRLEWKMAVATMVGLVHDIVVTSGIYALSGFEVTPSTVIALLTILGYSLYDTVVIFDRVKERASSLSAAGRVTYAEAANEALNQVLLRSFNTSIISLLPVGSLLFVGSFLLGAQTLRELALALFVGLAAGAYSSVFIAAPIVALWKEREPRWAALRERIAGRTPDGARSVARVAPAAPMAETMPTATSTAAPTAVAEASGRPQTRKPKQQRKRRKHGRR